ncbi:hypothetical protein [Pseudomonas bohemica]
MFNDAVLHGKEITSAEYAAGFPRR